MYIISHIIFKIFLIFFISIQYSIINQSFALNENNQIENSKKRVYVLGPGDKILVSVLNFEDFTSKVEILSDGSVNLPKVGSLYIAGLSIDDANVFISNAYAKIIKRPSIYIDLLIQRPLKISVTGEVQIPGIYSLGSNQTNQISNTDGGETLKISSFGYPTLIDAIQKAGGITLDGDLKKVKITRMNYLNKKIETESINYWDVIDNNKPLENFILFDGDNIHIPRIAKQSNEELIMISSSNLSPSTVTVNVIGEIAKPGSIKVKANTSLMQSILFAGGLNKTSNRQTIFLIRSNSDGSFYKRKFK